MVEKYMACGHDLQSYDASSSTGMDVVVLASDYAALEAERDSEKENGEYLGNQWAESLRQLDVITKDRDRLAAENAELRNEVETWKANNRRQVKAIELLRKDAERIDDLEEDFAEIQNIMGCNHDDMHHCVSTMEQELSETKADLSAANATIDKLLAIIEGAKGEYTGSCDAYNRACEIAGRKVE